MITTHYRVSVTCDTCGKTVRRKADDYPPSGIVPEDWVQASPPGSHQQKEFCSLECLSKWGSPTKPWLDDEDGEDVEVMT